MYCTTDITFYCNGSSEESLPKFQAMVDDMVTWLREKHPDIEAPAIDEPLTDDDIHVGFEEGDLPDEE